MSVTHGQCNARPTQLQVILLGDRGTCVLNKLSRVALENGAAGIQTCDLFIASTAPCTGLQSVGGEPLMSVTRGQCDTRPAARHHRTLAGAKLYCLVTEAHVC